MEIDALDVPDLEHDCIQHIINDLDCMQLARVVPVSKTWKAAATSNQLWKPIYRLEFGSWTAAQEPDSWHKQFLSFRDCGAAHHASFCTKFASALEAVQGFRVVLTPPASGDLRLVADCGEKGEVELIVSPNFDVPAGDMERMLMSHRTGLYAWTDTEEVQPDGQAPPRPPSWVVAYIHYEHLLRLWPLPLPQAFATALGPSAYRADVGVGVQLFLDFSSIEDKACLGRLHTSLMPCRAQAHTLWQSQPGIEFEAGLSSGSVSLVTPELEDVPPQERGAVLERILAGSCLVDFALLDENHRLLLGRAGVEVWNEEHQPVSVHALTFSTFWVRFLVDNVESSMRDNCIQIEPASSLLRVALSHDAAVDLRLTHMGSGGHLLWCEP